MSEPIHPANPNLLIKWGKLQAVRTAQARVGHAAFSGTGNSASVLFDAVKVELNGKDGGLSAVAMAAYQLPVEADLKKGFLGFLVHIRGAAAVSADGRVLLFVSVNGHGEVAKLNLVEGTEADTQFLHEQFVVEQRASGENNPNVPPLEPILITLTLIAKRATAKDRAMLTVDGVDILACFG